MRCASLERITLSFILSIPSWDKQDKHAILGTCASVRKFSAISNLHVVKYALSKYLL